MIFSHIGRFYTVFAKKVNKAFFSEKLEYGVLIPRYALFLAVVLMAVGMPGAYAEVFRQTMEGGVDVSITYPESVVSEQRFSISILVENRGWEDKRDVRFGFGSSPSLIPSQDGLTIERIADGGSYGATVDFDALSENENTHFLNIDYSQVLVQNNETPSDPFQTNIAIPIVIKGQPTVQIRTVTPESVFANAEFPFEVEILSEDIDLYDVNVRIIPPRDIEFRGDTLHTFSSIERGDAIGIRSEIITPEGEVGSQFNLPFEVVVTYRDHLGGEKTESKTVPLVLRPRTFMEITTDGGIWIGNFFIAPYVSLGTIIGIPAGAILSLLIRRAQKPKRRTRKTR